VVLHVKLIQRWLLHSEASELFHLHFPINRKSVNLGKNLFAEILTTKSVCILHKREEKEEKGRDMILFSLF
jgi:hypothetical protein